MVGTGDITHPGWRQEAREQLLPAGGGLFRLLPEGEREVAQRVPAACRRTVRFMLTGEISTIYKKGERTRKVHHLVLLPGFAEAERLAARLERIGNLHSDGRPILGLDSRDLLEICLEAGEGVTLIPAHIWTPWFSALGSRSGFDAIDACYGDLAPHIFAVETGLSADPPMCWRVSALDRYRLVSHSDAHSPDRLGREASRYHTGRDFFAMRRALETGAGYGGTVELFPEEGKYHLDGHRACKQRLTPEETRTADGLCPVCCKGVTVGVLNRVEQLADRPAGVRPGVAAPFTSLVPLPELLAEIAGVGPRTKRVAAEYEGLLDRLGPEITILEALPVEEIRLASSPLLAESIARLRGGKVVREAGFDGEYGRVHLFEPGELARAIHVASLFPDLTAEEPPAPRAAPSPSPAPVPSPAPPGPAERPKPAPSPTPGAMHESAIADLDPEQAAAVGHTTGPLLLIAGPGSGKTRTVTHRIAALIRDHQVPPEGCLALTFTRRAAAELGERLAALLGEGAEAVTVTTFHGLGRRILRAHAADLGLDPAVVVAPEEERAAWLAAALSVSERRAARWLGAISLHKRRGSCPETGGELATAFSAYERVLADHRAVDLDDLVARPVALLESSPELAGAWASRYPWISVDEYQDVDPLQYRLLRLLAPGEANLCAVGDPDQAIYAFRGADVGFFLRFQEDYPTTKVVELGRNYRSTATIVEAAGAAIAPTSLAPGRRLEAMAAGGEAITLHAAPTEQAEAEQVVATIEQLLGGHTFFSLDSGRADGVATGYGLSDIAILYRTEAQAPPLAEALARAGIPFQHRTHRPLVGRPGVAPLVAAAATEEGATVVARLRAAARRLGAEAASGLTLLLPLASVCDDDFVRFTDALPVATEMAAWEPGAAAVSLLTLHAAKGLEFPVVFLVGCEEGLLPLRRGRGVVDEAEERRLFFVGLTRAQERLILSRAKMRAHHGRPTPASPSPFLADLPPPPPHPPRPPPAATAAGTDGARPRVDLNAKRQGCSWIRAFTPPAPPPPAGGGGPPRPPPPGGGPGGRRPPSGLTRGRCRGRWPRSRCGPAGSRRR